MTERSAEQLAETLSDVALKLCLGWFSFGQKGEVNISPPHASKAANQIALDELLDAGIISHAHECARDIHRYRGSDLARQICSSPRARRILSETLGI